MRTTLRLRLPYSAARAWRRRPHPRGTCAACGRLGARWRPFGLPIHRDCRPGPDSRLCEACGAPGARRLPFGRRLHPNCRTRAQLARAQAKAAASMGRLDFDDAPGSLLFDRRPRPELHCPGCIGPGYGPRCRVCRLPHRPDPEPPIWGEFHGWTVDDGPSEIPGGAR